MNFRKKMEQKNWFFVYFIMSFFRYVALYHCTILSALIVTLFFGSDLTSHGLEMRFVILSILVAIKLIIFYRIVNSSDEKTPMRFIVRLLADILGAGIALLTPLGFVYAITILSLVTLLSLFLAYTQKLTLEEMKRSGELEEVIQNIEELEENLLNRKNFMKEFKVYLTDKIKTELPKLNLDNVYAISFYLNCNEVYETVPLFSISCNTENKENEDSLSEARWNYAYWLMNEIDIVCEEDPDSIIKLKRWYACMGIENPGYEDLSWDVAYDENATYIGKGPEGVYQFTELLQEIVKELHESGFIKDTFGKELPIIIHDLEYVWYMIEATLKANPEHVIKDFKNYYN